MRKTEKEQRPSTVQALEGKRPAVMVEMLEFGDDPGLGQQSQRGHAGWLPGRQDQPQRDSGDGDHHGDRQSHDDQAATSGFEVLIRHCTIILNRSDRRL
jgi:hypothetical protein